MTQNSVTSIPNQFTDDFVVDNARISFAKSASHYTPEQNARLINYLMREKHINPAFHGKRTIVALLDNWQIDILLQNKCLAAGIDLQRRDDNYWYITGSQFGLLRLAHAFHWRKVIDMMYGICPVLTRSYETHFGVVRDDNSEQVAFLKVETPHKHESFTFYFETELATKAQLYTHCIGIAKSAASHRYIEPDNYYVPIAWRGKADNVKQGSGGEIVEEIRTAKGNSYKDCLDECFEWYAINPHIANEQRRYDLPVATMTQFRMTGTREAWQRVLRERTHHTAQQEIRELMTVIGETIG
jgi:hypothetical protein